MSAQQPFPFSVCFPLSIRQQRDSVAICGANRGEGWPILCTVPRDTNHDKDAASIVAACQAHVDNALCSPGSDRAQIKALRDSLSMVLGAVEWVAKSKIPTRSKSDIAALCDWDRARAALALGKDSQ